MKFVLGEKLLPNVFFDEVQINLPRLLSMIDRDPSSLSYGLADRYFWAWGLIDFGNGSFQGMAHGFARLWVNDLWPFKSSDQLFLSRLDSLFVGAKSITRADGSLEEAFPNEGSYCVTALVSFDLLCTYDLMASMLTTAMKARWQQIIQPMIEFLIKSDETHAIISNHLATAIAALIRWEKITGDQAAEKKINKLLQRILQNQSSEGWFREYSGADPGYQTLCTYYLVDAHIQRPSLNLLPALRKSIKFLWHFAQPDGSFGGLYGSRCTRFYFPSGILALANEIPEARALAAFMSNSVMNKTVVTLSSIDEPNLVPMFNSYCWAATLQKTQKKFKKPLQLIPSMSGQRFSKQLRDSGIIIDSGPKHYTIVSSSKGGIVYHFRDNKSPVINQGLVFRNELGEYASSQKTTSVEFKNKSNEIIISTRVIQMTKRLPTPFHFLILRILSISLFRMPILREFIKNLLVKLLITNEKDWPLKGIRKIILGENLQIYDCFENKKGYEQVADMQNVVPIHMASKGYWQIQDESKQ